MPLRGQATVKFTVLFQVATHIGSDRVCYGLEETHFYIFHTIYSTYIFSSKGVTCKELHILFYIKFNKIISLV
jgi:hypothetical protein